MYEPNAPGWFDHVSPDPQRDGEFYAAVSGHQLTTMEGDMRILQRGEQWYASVSYAQNGEKAQWKPIFVVDSLARIHETVPRHGGAIVIPEMPVPGSSLCVFSEPVNGTLMTVMAAGDHPD
jgi:predicted enzyme related to lactoylglutathione lyase